MTDQLHRLSRKFWQRSLSLAAILGLALPLSQIAVAPAKAAQKGSLIIGIDETASEYWAEYTQGAQDIANSLGAKLIVVTSNYQGSQLLAQLGAIFATGCDQCALATDPSSNAFVKAVVHRSAMAQVPIVTIWNRPENIHPWDTDPKYWVAHTSFDGVMSGYYQAQALCKALGGHGQIAAIEGVPSTPPAYQRIAGLKKALAECPGVTLLDTEVGDWQETKAQNITRTWIARYGSKLNGIFASNDAMARGAVAALREKNLNGKIPVTGSDGSKVALDMVKSGDMLVTVWNDPVLQGAVSIAIAHAAAVGDIDPAKLTHAQRDFYLKQEVVDKSNVDHFLDLKAHAPNYTYAELKADFWKDSAGELPVGANK
ncbi:sugar ABC transporter substrate-binding protein [Acidisoma cellulosilytica]|uniref:Sugar ABC transporter substrate-binding protein n=1 Tax=Acidisoma cellulosilyticum TaxID=2802395 RepID=A0A963Z2P3_9PROT|nr:sugar ABC transporter substrate-binding protein [Acidisoma cellulosilyticum]MCB8881511.1 sugar ABC transporter substrate-binding protein [Acidisoma cellulosilyticum]